MNAIMFCVVVISAFVCVYHHLTTPIEKSRLWNIVAFTTLLALCCLCVCVCWRAMKEGSANSLGLFAPLVSSSGCPNMEVRRIPYNSWQLYRSQALALVVLFVLYFQIFTLIPNRHRRPNILISQHLP